MVVEQSSRLGLVRRSPSFGLLFLATAGSSIGTYLAAIALTVDVYDRTGSGVWVAALLIADFLPIVLIGLLLGPLVDLAEGLDGQAWRRRIVHEAARDRIEHPRGNSQLQAILEFDDQTIRGLTP